MSLLHYTCKGPVVGVLHMRPDPGMAVDRAPLTHGMALVYTYDGVKEGVGGIG